MNPSHGYSNFIYSNCMLSTELSLNLNSCFNQMHLTMQKSGMLWLVAIFVNWSIEYVNSAPIMGNVTFILKMSLPIHYYNQCYLVIFLIEFSILLRVMALCYLATSHFLLWCLPILLTYDCITRGQWVNSLVHWRCSSNVESVIS